MAHPFKLIVSTPSAQLDPALAIAASRTGALGLLDLTFALDTSSALQAVATLNRFAGGPYGVRLSLHQGDLLEALLVAPTAHFQFVVLSGRDPQALVALALLARRQQRHILLEVTSADQLPVALDLGLDGVIAKGNESGGFVGEETAFVLMQACLQHTTLPVFVQGGIGLHSVAACYVAGAAGVVLDAQLLLTRESRLPPAIRERIAAMEGNETVCLGGELGALWRVYSGPGLPALDAIRRLEDELSSSTAPLADRQAAWVQAVMTHAGWADPRSQLLLVGQDATFAADFAKRFTTVSGVLGAFQQAIDTHVATAVALRPFAADAPFARAHGIPYPIFQGPMTRVSDTAEFALAVAEGGGLPFLALALMRGPELRTLLERTRDLLGQRPWGVGVLGFVPPDVRQEQLDAVRATHPSAVIIAGGRPDQAAILEQEGIPTYLHVPSPGLLRMFLADGARRFIFEGRECGGHVGPRSSFVLWETMISLLIEHLNATKDTAAAQELSIVFAGGIHDDRSAAAVAAMAAPLAERGVRLGLLMGTAYLFTREAVTTGAITQTYQDATIASHATVLLESGPGHVTRCLPTVFAQTFIERKRTLLSTRVSGEQLREELEALNLGRLRIASKGIIRNPQFNEQPNAPRYLAVDEGIQRTDGMYMVGQVAALRDQPVSIAELHHEVAVASSARLAAIVRPQPAPRPQPQPKPLRVAIIGMAGILPGANNLQAYWENIINKVDAITEVPPDRWDWRRFYDPDKAARDKVYSHWGGFIEAVPFNPLDYGMPPNSIPSIETIQLLMLEVVRAGLADAGYLDRPFPRERTSVVVAAGGGLGDLGYLYGFRAYLPHFVDADTSKEVIDAINKRLPEWTEDSFPGILLNVIAGRVANRFDLSGPNFIVDAACGSSLAALDVAVKDLAEGRTDMAIVGGGDTVQSPFAFLAFSKTQALSPTGRCRPFDANADGIAISEGVAIVVLKRLADAERDGDRIYAVIDGVGASSDGRDRSLTAPRPAGQLLALRRAYAQAGYSAATVGLIEAHGTGTKLGDQVEFESLSEFFQDFNPTAQACAVGSVKSMIGHTKATAGLAGLIKTTLGLYHKALPPTLVDTINPRMQRDDTPFYVNDTLRPWLSAAPDSVRRAGVSAFGFGGTNFHAALEEYRNEFLPPTPSLHTWPAELLLWRGSDRAALARELTRLETWLSAGNQPPLRDLAMTLYQRYRQASDGLSIALVTATLDDLKQKVAQVRAVLAGPNDTLNDPRGVYFSAKPLARDGKVAFLFSGQGSQYIHMLRDLVLQFPRVRACFERANWALQAVLPKPLSDLIFPVSAYSEEAAHAARAALTATRIAQPALGITGVALAGLLQDLGVRPAMVAGHSYGEIAALYWAGVLSEDDLFRVSEMRGRLMTEAAGADAGTMAAIRAGREIVAAAITGLSDLTMANLNAPNQTVISGTRVAVEQAVQHFKAQGVGAQVLNVACAFHSPLVAGASQRFGEFLQTIDFRVPSLPVYSNTHAAAYPSDPQAIRAILSAHLAHAVEFQREIEAMYADGARIFIETGPQGVLSGLTDQTLEGRPHLTVALDRQNTNGLVTLQKGLGQLAAAGLELELDALYDGRKATRVDFNNPYVSPEQARFGPTTWMISGGHARPLREAQRDGAHPAVLAPIDVRLPGAVGEAKPAVPAQSATNGVTATNGRSPSAAAPPPSTPPAAPTAPPSVPVAAADEAAQVMLHYQHMMGHFLASQQGVMLSYLGATAADMPMPPVALPLPTPVAPTGVPFTEPVVRAVHAPPPPAPFVPPPPVVVPPVEPATPALTTATLTHDLLTLVSERTGYPVEMLNLDADLESDLSIDSIKRVEILGAFRRSSAALDTLMAGQAMEQLQSRRTLRGIVEWLTRRTAEPATTATPKVVPALLNGVPHGASSKNGDGAAQLRAPTVTAIERFTLVTAECPHTQPPSPLPRSLPLLISDDGTGVARHVATLLERAGYRTVMLAQSGPDALDLADATAVRAWVDRLHQQYGACGGIVHLAPLAALQGSMDQLDTWQTTRRRLVHGFFHLINALHTDLSAATQLGGGVLLTATATGGQFAPTPTLPPIRGGLAGLLKTAAHELIGVRVKALDVAPDAAPELVAETIVRELHAGDGVIEVGYVGDMRRTLRMVPLPVAGRPVVPTLSSDAVVIITGGARGVTAQAALALAQRYRPTLLLVGRSPVPAAEEAPTTAGLTTPRAIKEALIAERTHLGQRSTLNEIETAYNRLLQEREIRATLTAMKQTGATVVYIPLDVRNETAVRDFIAETYARYGRIDGVIHGAGIIEDRLLKDKGADSFERVVSTKIDSALLLSRYLNPETLRFLVFFSSVSGHFGNRGQGDYAAANQMLDQFAADLDVRWATHVVSMAWGPWDGGMVSPELRREFAQRGVSLIPVEIGCERLIEEITQGRKGEASVLICGTDTQTMSKEQSTEK